VGLSLIKAVGLSCATDSADEYVRIAKEYAADLRWLSDLRKDLRRRMTSSPLCDRAAFTSRFGSALRQMWTTYCSAPN
jgi:predicted O-linked N-acetylglucosamine transferase (SPINDLY family)